MNEFPEFLFVFKPHHQMVVASAPTQTDCLFMHGNQASYFRIFAMDRQRRANAL